MAHRISNDVEVPFDPSRRLFLNAQVDLVTESRLQCHTRPIAGPVAQERAAALDEAAARFACALAILTGG